MTSKTDTDIETLFSVGAQYGYSRSRRHPSTGGYIFGVKNNVEIFDLEKTQKALTDTLDFVKKLGSEGKTILLVSGKAESKKAIMDMHESTNLPYVTGRWIGGTLTNFEVVRKRVDRLVDLRKKQEKGGLEKYTKKERLMMRREAERLSDKFEGIIEMEKKPDALFIIDPEQESIAVAEAKHIGAPVVALASSDCDITQVDHPIPANDSNIKSIGFFVDAVSNAYSEGLKEKAAKKAEKPSPETTGRPGKDPKASKDDARASKKEK